MTDELTDVSVNSPISLPALRRIDAKEKFYNYTEHVVDYESLESLNASIVQARMALFEVTEYINSYDRKERKAKVEYERALRREYLKSNAKTDKERSMRAALNCEELENAYIVAGQVREELTRLSSTLRLELQTLQAVGNNIRQQLKVV